jgi:hypothetical protein
MHTIEPRAQGCCELDRAIYRSRAWKTRLERYEGARSTNPCLVFLASSLRPRQCHTSDKMWENVWVKCKDEEFPPDAGACIDEPDFSQTVRASPGREREIRMSASRSQLPSQIFQQLLLHRSGRRSFRDEQRRHRASRSD